MRKTGKKCLKCLKLKVPKVVFLFITLVTLVHFSHSELYAETAMINSFSHGEVTDKIRARTDVEQWYSSARLLENMFVKPWGPVEKRPGTYYIATVDAVGIVPGTPETPAVLGDYPVLRAVDDQADPGLDHDIAISSMDDLNTYFRFNGGTYDPAGQIFGNYYLTQDIDMSVTEDWTYGWQMDGAFQGNFDGCGYTLSNMHQTRYYTDQAYNRGGFFHSIGAWETGFSTVANLTIADAVIYTDHGGVLACRVHAYAGDGAKIYNCHTTGTVYATSTGGVNQTVNNVGGFVAETYTVTTTGPATFYDCTADVNIVGVPDDSVLYKPINIGGFIGQAAGSGAFYNCESHGDVTVTGFISDSEYVGGFVGNNPAAVPSWYYYSSATGDVEGDKYVGGFIGGDILYRGYMCSATGDVTCNTSYGGGFIGYSSAAGRMYDSYAWGDVTGGDYIGGYLGYSTYGYFYRSYSIGEVTGTNVGGFAGYTQYTNLSWCHWDTETSGTETSDGGTGHTTTWMKTKPNWEDDHFSWDFDTVWYMEYTASVPAVPDSEYTIEIDPRRLIGFEYPQEKSYVIAMGEKIMAFYKSD